MKLQLEVNKNELPDEPVFQGKSGGLLLVTPAIDETYWLARVRVSDSQAVVCFPKFFTLGIGFQNEEDWNTNLPYTCPSRQIFGHISHNKGNDSIPDNRCVKAIEMLQKFCEEINNR